jgi:hypothetical protein
MRDKRAIAGLMLLGAVLAPEQGRAAEAYQATLTVDGQTYTRSFSSIDAALDVLRRGDIRSIAPNYTAASQVTAQVSIRGVPATVTRQAGSNALVLTVPGAGLQRTFDGATAAEAAGQLAAFATGEVASDELRSIYDAIVATSTIDPVAGNPSSLQGQSVIADYAAGTALPGDTGRLDSREAGWHFAAGLSFTDQQAEDFDTQAYSLPLAVSYAFRQDGPELFLSVPLMLTDSAGAQSYIGSAGLGLRIPVVVTPELRWALTPAVRAGAAGSSEVGSVGSAYGASLTSDLRVGLPAGLVLGIGNTVGYYETKPVKVGDYDLRYDLQNAYYRNGAWISRPFGTVGGLPLLLGASFTDTRLAGDDLAVSSWQEYGISATMGSTSPARLTLTYLDGRRGYDALHVGLSFAF